MPARPCLLSARPCASACPRLQARLKAAEEALQRMTAEKDAAIRDLQEQVGPGRYHARAASLRRPAADSPWATASHAVGAIQADQLPPLVSVPRLLTAQVSP